MGNIQHGDDQIIKCSKCGFPILPHFNFGGLCEMCIPLPDEVDEDISPESLDLNVDYATRSSLQNYNDGRMWFVIKDEVTSLGQIAYALLKMDIQYVADLERAGALEIAKNLDDVIGNDFYCLYTENAYVVKQYR